jgi:hypothetical protein
MFELSERNRKGYRCPHVWQRHGKNVCRDKLVQKEIIYQKKPMYCIQNTAILFPVQNELQYI